VHHAIILAEIQIDVLKRDDAKLARVRRTLTELAAITGLPWVISQHSKDSPYHYALDDAHVALAERLEWDAYHRFVLPLNEALNADAELVSRHKGRRDVFSYGDDKQGVRFASVGGTVFNGKRIAASLLLAPAMEDEAALAALKKISIAALVKPIRAMLVKNAETASERHKRILEQDIKPL
jgi:hypothetical protein